MMQNKRKDSVQMKLEVKVQSYQTSAAESVIG